MKAILGGKDAQSVENSRPYNPDLKIANNNFEVANGRVLGFGGEEILPFFISLSLKFKNLFELFIWADKTNSVIDNFFS